MMFPRTPEQLFLDFRDCGDTQALARLFDRLAPELVGLARHWVRDAGEAEDVLQATFLAALEGAERYQSGRPVRAWLVGILARQAGLVRRRRARQWPADQLVEPDVPTPVQEASSKELLNELARVLERLPAPYGEILTLHLQEGHGTQVIARRLNRRTSTVRVQLHRGLKLLRRALPAGLSGGAVIVLAPAREAAVRRVVLRAAGAPTGQVALATGITLGGLAKLALVVLGTGGLAWITRPIWAELGGSRPRTTDPMDVADGTARPAALEPRPAHDDRLDPGTATRAALEASAVSARAADAPPRVGEQDSPTEPGAAFRLYGRVVEHGSGRPLEGARVQAWLPSAAPHTQVAPAASRETDAAGSYRIEGLREPPTAVLVTAPGFADLPLALSWSQTDLARNELELELPLEPGFLLRGRVVDRLGNPLAGVPVFRYLPFAAGVARRKVGYGSHLLDADADGRFALRERVATVSTRPESVGLLALTPEGLAWADVRITPELGAGEVELVEAPSATLRVTVLDEAGVPLANARVWADPELDPFAHLRRIEPASFFGLDEADRGRLGATTDAAGQATLAGLPREVAGGTDYTIVAIGPDGREERCALRFEGEQAELTLRFGAGRAWHLSGLTLEDSGQPLAGVEVRLDGSATESDGGGRFQLAVPLPLRTTPVLEARKPGYAPYLYELPVQEPSMPPGMATEGIELRLRALAPISGHIVDQHGEGVRGAQLTLLPEGPADGRRGGGQGITSEDDGAFLFHEAGAGAWWLHVQPPPGDSSFADWRRVLVEGGADDLRVVLGRSPPGQVSLALHVVDAASGEALTPDEVRVVPRAPIGPLFTLDHGDHGRTAGGAVIEHLRPGAWRVWVRVAGYAHGHVDLDVPGGRARLERTLALGSAARVRGQVARTAPLPVGASETLQVRLRELRGTPLAGDWALATEAFVTPPVEPDGRFDSGALLPGLYELHYLGPQGVAYQEFELEPGAVRTLQLEPRTPAVVRFVTTTPIETGVLDGRLVSPDGGWRSPPVGSPREDPAADRRRSLSMLVPPGPWNYEVTYRTYQGALFTARGSLTLTDEGHPEVHVTLR